MKGIILAGGSGTRLYPITRGVSTLMLAGTYTGSIQPTARRISARSPEKIRHPAGRGRQ